MIWRCPITFFFISCFFTKLIFSFLLDQCLQLVTGNIRTFERFKLIFFFTLFISSFIYLNIIIFLYLMIFTGNCITVRLDLPATDLWSKWCEKHQWSYLSSHYKCLFCKYVCCGQCKWIIKIIIIIMMMINRWKWEVSFITRNWSKV